MKTIFRFLLLASLLPLPAVAQITTTVSGGTSLNIFLPLNQFSAQGVYEGIYLQSQLNQAGNITRLAFEKNDGTDLRAIDGIRIFMKATTATQFTAGPIDSTGYQRVFKGSFTNSTAAGFQEIVLDQAFSYDNLSNLAILVIRQNGTALAPASNGPRARWLYQLSTAGIARRYDGGSPLTSSTNLVSSNVLPNLRLTFAGPTATRLTTAPLAAHLFPNPVRQYGTVQLAAGSPPAIAIITDLLGRSQQAPQVLVIKANGTAPLALAALPAGTYFLHITQGSTRSVQRFVKE